jgi:hypothetical protein
MFNRKTRNIISKKEGISMALSSNKLAISVASARRQAHRNVSHEHVQQVTPRTVADFEEKMGSGQVSSMYWDGFTSKIAKLCRFRA